MFPVVRIVSCGGSGYKQLRRDRHPADGLYHSAGYRDTAVIEFPFAGLCPPFVDGCPGKIDDDAGTFHSPAECVEILFLKQIPAYRDYFVSFFLQEAGEMPADVSACSGNCYFHLARG